jgi:hypothetical protein
VVVNASGLPCQMFSRKKPPTPTPSPSGKRYV